MGSVKMDGHKAFIDRIRTEGREREWEDAFKAKWEELGGTPQSRLKALAEARKSLDFKGNAKEVELYYARQVKKLEAKIDHQAIERVYQEKEKAHAQSYEEVLRSLPQQASTRDELNWVRRHPAMTSLRRSTEKKDVVIGVRDILHSSAGPAPSQSAVVMLQHWVGDPSEFFKQVITQQKKQQEEEAAKVAQRDKTIDEINAMLDSLEAETADA